MGIPLELVKYSVEDGKFSVGKGALEVLKKVHAPLGVVAVCGRARQGKSYILNQLLKQTGNGFVVGPTHRPCTKGLWMWSEPQPRVNPDGSQHYLVLLDTEGIDAWDQTAQYSTQIFSLAVLLSSLFVYNQMGGIDESALDRLSLVTEMTKHIRVKAGGGNERLGDFTPAFLWLLRDFYLKLEDNGVKVSPRDYLETALLPVPGSGTSVEAKNSIRASIKALFPDRDCYAVVRPMNDEAQLVNLDNVDPHELRPEFREGVDQLIKLIFSKAEPKRFGAQFMTGPVLAGLVQAYVDALNNGAVPTIATAWQGVAEQESRRAADAAEAKYAELFNTDVSAEESAMDLEHERCVALALEVFRSIAVGELNIQSAHEARFRQAVKARFGEVRARRLAEAASTVTEMLYKATLNITQAARSGASLQDVQAQIGAFVEQYASMASGPTKWQRLAEFLNDTYGAISQELLGRTDKAGKEAVEQARAELEAAKAELAAAVVKASSSGTIATELASERDAAQVASRKLAADLEQAIARAVAAEARVQQLEAQIIQEREAAAANLRGVEERSRALQAQLSAAQAQVVKLESEVGGSSSLVTTLKSQIASDSEQWRGKYDQAVRELAEAVRERDGAVRGRAEVLRERDSAVRERDVALSRATTQGSEVQQANALRAQALAQLASVQSDLQGHVRLRDDLHNRLEQMIAQAQAEAGGQVASKAG